MFRLFYVMFNDVLGYVLQSRTSEDMRKFLQLRDEEKDDDLLPAYMGRWCSVEGADTCLEFLDYYFTYCVEWSPNGKYKRLLNYLNKYGYTV